MLNVEFLRQKVLFLYNFNLCFLRKVLVYAPLPANIECNVSYVSPVFSAMLQDYLFAILVYIAQRCVETVVRVSAKNYINSCSLCSQALIVELVVYLPSQMR